MTQRITRWLAPPRYADPDKQRRAAYLNALIWAGMLILVALVISRAGGGFFSVQNDILLCTAALLVIFRLLLARGYVTQIGYAIVISIWSVLAYLAWSADGIRDVTFVALIVVALIAALVMGWRAAVAMLAITVLAGWGLALMEAAGMRSQSFDSAPNMARDYTAILTVIGLLIYLFETSLTRSLRDARQAAESLTVTNRELAGLQEQLGQRVEERTAELVSSTALANRRAEQLRTVSEVARKVSAVKEVGPLLTEVTDLISQRFGYYHTGIFLLDATREFVELRASNSDGGQRMLARHHRLRLQGSGIVPSVASTGQPRVTADVTQDARFLKNPDLPETRSEMSLPLRLGEDVIGVLDIQSSETSAFAAEDVEVLQTLANQVAVAIENARLFDEARRALRSAEEAYNGFLQQEWRSFRQHMELAGMQYDGKTVEPVYRDSEFAISGSESGMAIPLVMHGETIGELTIGEHPDGRPWSTDDQAVLGAVADRVALALENARLLEGTMHRAEREKAITAITNKIRATNDPQTMIETAARELQMALGASQVNIIASPKRLQMEGQAGG
jgi:GAF domain-containing protein